MIETGHHAHPLLAVLIHVQGLPICQPLPCLSPHGSLDANPKPIHRCQCAVRHSMACKPEAPTLLVCGVQSPEAIVLDPVKLGLGDRLQLRGGGTAHLLEEGHQVPLPMATEGIPHTLHCQLLQQPPDYS